MIEPGVSTPAPGETGAGVVPAESEGAADPIAEDTEEVSDPDTAESSACEMVAECCESLFGALRTQCDNLANGGDETTCAASQTAYCGGGTTGGSPVGIGR